MERYGGSETGMLSSRESDISRGQHVRIISKEKKRFAKAAEHYFSTVIFRVVKLIERRPRVIYELDDFDCTPIEGQYFFREELTPVRITHRIAYKIDEILDKRVKRGIREYLVRWRGYSQDFDTRVPAVSVKNILESIATQSHYFLTLFSNASRDIYEQNTHAVFSVKLAQPVDLVSTSNWEVGLCEISCTSSPPIWEDSPALIYCHLISPQFFGDYRPLHVDISLPIINVMSARVSIRVLCACRASQVSRHPDRVPDNRGVAHPLRGHHDAHKSGDSFSKNLLVEDNCIKLWVAILNRTFTAMHPLEVYYLNKAGIGTVYSAPLYLQRVHGMGIFSAVSFAGSSYSCGAGPKQWAERLCVPVAGS